MKNSDQLNLEYKVIRSLEGGTGIPKAYWCSIDQNLSPNTIMVMDMLGPNLEDLFQICGKKFGLKTVLMIADQLVIIIFFFSGQFLRQIFSQYH
jgi:hypothetical protein